MVYLIKGLGEQCGCLKREGKSLTCFSQPGLYREPERKFTQAQTAEPPYRALWGEARLSGPRLHLHHLGPGAEAQVLVDEHQAGGRARLLRRRKALLLALRNGDLEEVPGRGAVPFAARVQRLWLGLQEHHGGLGSGGRHTGRAGRGPGLVTELVPPEALQERVAHAAGGAAVGLVGQVGFQVAPQLGGQRVSPAALRAGEGPLARVQALVGAQRVRVPQRLPAHGAEVGLARVGDEVAPQLRPLREGGGAVRAAVRALSRVQPQVPAQAAPLAEGAAAVRAEEGLLPRVKPHVVPQGALAGQGPPAHGAGARGRGRRRLVRLAVQPQGGPAGEGLAALLAAEGPGAGVDHLVLPEVPPGAVGLVALRAGEGPQPAVAQRVGLEALFRAVALAALRAEEGLVARVHERVLPQVAELQEGLATLPAAVPPALFRGASRQARGAPQACGEFSVLLLCSCLGPRLRGLPPGWARTAGAPQLLDQGSTELGGPVRRSGSDLTLCRALLGSRAALRSRWGLGRALLTHAAIFRQRAEWLALLRNRGLGLGRKSRAHHTLCLDAGG